MNEAVIQLKNLSKYFTVETNFWGKPTSVLKAVDNFTLDIFRGEAFGLVGESGCGKSTVGKMIAGLYKPTSGNIIFGDGTDLAKLSPKDRRAYSKNIQLIFQDPYASLNPRMKVEEIIAEPLKLIGKTDKSEIYDRTKYLLECVGLSDYHMDRYPHEFSGGQRQRIGIARALAMNPDIIICDEPVSALDVSVQAQVLNLLDDLKHEFSLTYLFIAHGLNVVKHISDRVGVMYMGQLVEYAEKHELYNNPQHPYTQALLSAIPSPNPHRKKEQILLQGEVTSPIDPPDKCRFCTRCFRKEEKCSQLSCPTWTEVSPGHFVSCHLFE